MCKLALIVLFAGVCFFANADDTSEDSSSDDSSYEEYEYKCAEPLEKTSEAMQEILANGEELECVKYFGLQGVLTEVKANDEEDEEDSDEAMEKDMAKIAEELDAVFEKHGAENEEKILQCLQDQGKAAMTKAEITECQEDLQEMMAMIIEIYKAAKEGENAAE